MPPASLEPRDTDVALLPEQIKSIPFFAQLRKPPDPQRFPGTLILRFFRKGEVICRQGEAGWSAFYILSDRDALDVLEKYRAAGMRDNERQRIEGEVRRLSGQPGRPDQDAVLVYLALPRPPKGKEPGWLERVVGRFLGSKKSAAPDRPLYIPIDAPTDIPYETKQASLKDGDLFGEMSSLYGTPRSATVVATRDMYALEMLRNILDEVKRDPAFQKRMDDLYRERVLRMHLSGLPLFQDLSEQQMARVRDQAELLRFKDGDILCDENDRSDSLFLIRRGMVRVVKNASALLGLADVPDWAALTRLIGEAITEGAAGPQAVLGKLLPAPARELLLRENPLPGALEQQDFLYGLNEVIKSRELPDSRESQAVNSPRLSALRGTLPKKTADWPEQALREFNRQMLEELLPGALAPFKRSKGPQTTLAFRGRGEFIGEMGLLLKQPRMASCIAYVHPIPEGPGAPPVWLRQGDLVEIVRITEQTFWELVGGSERMMAEVKERTAARQQETIRQMQARTWDDPLHVLTSERFGKMGLVQGQRLMLIDLNSCTRCDECVKACVDSHADGYSRLFLDGERFGKYLVPSTCRACLEPVCMIGCPVGSIHRGDNRQIVIEDWCIGCGLCARNCPYGSIQMEDIGVIASESHGWKFAPADIVKDRPWQQPSFRDSSWAGGRAPFYNDPDLADRLARLLPASSATTPPAICFRREFSLSGETATAREFVLELTSTDETASLWINGIEMKTKEKAKRGVRTFTFRREEAKLAVGRNLLAVRVNLVGGMEGTLFDLRMDEVRTPMLPFGITGEFTEKNYGKLAVVCDLCSNQYGQKPACVTACPHDAALRVDARFEFPQQ